MIIKLLTSSEEDLIKGWEFYENQCNRIGDYFLDTIYSEIESLKLYAGIHPVYFNYHRMLTRRFPFAIYYKIDKDTILIDSILHTKRNPVFIKDRLNNSQ